MWPFILYNRYEGPLFSGCSFSYTWPVLTFGSACRLTSVELVLRAGKHQPFFPLLLGALLLPLLFSVSGKGFYTGIVMFLPRAAQLCVHV